MKHDAAPFGSLYGSSDCATLEADLVEGEESLVSRSGGAAVISLAAVAGPVLSYLWSLGTVTDSGRLVGFVVSIYLSIVLAAMFAPAAIIALRRRQGLGTAVAIVVTGIACSHLLPFVMSRFTDSSLILLCYPLCAAASIFALTFMPAEPSARRLS